MYQVLLDGIMHSSINELLDCIHTQAYIPLAYKMHDFSKLGKLSQLVSWMEALANPITIHKMIASFLTPPSFCRS